MDHQYKNPNQHQAVVRNRNQTTPVTDSQDVQTMEYVDQQDVAGNDFVAEQLPAASEQVGVGAHSPWDVNLFSDAKPGMNEVDWARNSTSDHNLKGRPRTGTKSLHKETGTLAEGEHGDFTYQNTVRMRQMTGAELSYDGKRVNTQERAATVDGVSVSEKARQEYAGGGAYKNSVRGGVETTGYIGSKGGSESTAEAQVQDGTLLQSRSNDYNVQGKRENGKSSGSIALGGERSTKFTSDVGGVERSEERGNTGSLNANVMHTKDSIQGTIGANVSKKRAVEQKKELSNGSIETVNHGGTQKLGGEIGRDAQGNISLAGAAGLDGSASRQVESVDAQGRSVKNIQHASGGAELKGSHRGSTSSLTANLNGKVGAGQEIVWSDHNGAHSQKKGITLGGNADHDLKTHKTDLRSDLNINQTDQTVETLSEQEKQTRTLDQGFTLGAKAKLENGSLVDGSTGFQGAYNIAHKKEDEKKEASSKTTGVVTNKAGVRGAIDDKQKKIGTTYSYDNTQERVEMVGVDTRTEKDKITGSTAVDHDFVNKKTQLKGDIGYSTGVQNTTQLDAQTQTRSGYQHDVNAGGSVALEENASKIANSTRKAGYAFSTTNGKTTTVDGRTDSIDNTHKTGVTASTKGDGVVLGADHDFTSAKSSTWAEENEQHKTNSKLTVGGGVKENQKTDDLDVATRMGYTTGSSVTTQVDDATKKTEGVSHNMSGAVNLDLDNDDKSADDSSVRAAYGIGFNSSTERTEGAEKITNTSTHKLDAKSDWQKNAQNADLAYTYKNGSKVETATGSKENSNIHKITLGGSQKIDRSEDDIKKQQNIKAGYSLANSEKEVVKDGSETLTNIKTNTIGGDVGYNVQDKNFTTGVKGAYKSEKIRADGSKIISQQENSATLSQDGKATLARKTEDVGFEKITKPTDETKIKTRKGVLTSEINASTQKEEDGLRSFGVGGKVGYTALKKDVTFKAKSMSAKVSGLRQGDKDVDGQDKVRTLQKALNKAGQRIEVNGIFDATTASAVEKFQKANSLPVSAQGEIDAQTAAALPNVRMLPEDTKFSASVEAGTASADANIKSTFKADQIKVEGVAGAKVTMVGGNAKISLPVFNWNLGGEQMAVAVTAGVNASILAEANGNIKMDIGKSDKGLNANIEGGGKAFVGAKAGVEVGAEVQWKRNSAQYYGDLIKKFATSLPGSWDDHLVNKVPAEIWPQLAQVLVGTRTSTIMYARAGVEGQAGLGAEATFNAGIKNGMIEASGSFGGSFGLGGSAKTSVGLHAVDGVRLGGVLAMKGATWLSDTLPAAKQWLQNVEEELDKKIDQYLEAKKQEGGVSGFFAGAVDFVGDDLLNLW